MSDEVKKQPRVRRVTTDITMPHAGETVGVVSLDVNGLDTIINYEVDFATAPTEFVQQAALAGLVARLGIAYSGVTEPEKIKEAVEKEIANFKQGKFVSRSTADKKVAVPLVVVAWIRAVGKNAEDKAVVAEYMGAWKEKDTAGKNKIRNNERVATIYEQLMYEKRMAKIDDSASEEDEDALEL